MQAEFNSWLSTVLPNRHPDLVDAYNFNVSETSTHYVIEVIGARHYDPSNEDWACDELWTSRPRTFEMPKAGCNSDWKQALQLVERLVGNYLLTEESLLNTAEAVTVGFVDGNLKKVWPRGA